MVRRRFRVPALLGARPGGAYAAAWAALLYFGVEGYRDLAARTAEAVDRIVAGLGQIAGLRLLGKPQGPLVAYGSAEPGLDIFVVGEQLQARGWNINRLQFPGGLHAMVTARHLEVVDDYLADLAASVEVARAHPEYAQQGGTAVYGMIARAPLRDMVRAQVLETFASYYAPDAG